MSEFAVSGLAGEIRAATTSEQFDLSNYTDARVRDLVRSAFGSPLDSPTEMIRFTFVVGGGKLVRAKYDEDLPKWFTAALREIGYGEDRSAALDYSSQRTFKQQHDTGQNLKTIIVFPEVCCALAKSTSKSSEEATHLPSKSPEYIVVVCELATLQDIVAAKVVSWSQKKQLLKLLQDSSNHFKELEGKLIRGELLTPLEQGVYDSNSGQDEEKINWLQGETKAMVDLGQLTAIEKNEVLTHTNSNLASITTEIETAKVEGKLKKVSNLEERKANIIARLAVVNAINPIQHHRLKHGDEIQKLRMKLLSFAPLEEKQRSQGLSLAELKILEPKPDMEESIRGLELASKGWFQDEELFKFVCDFETSEAVSKFAAKKKSSSSKKPTTSGSTITSRTMSTSRDSGTITWSTVGKKSKVTAPKSRVNSTGGGGGFATAFSASDSDSDS